MISFTFVVSNINSIISQNHKNASQRSKNIIFLEKMRLKYGLSFELIEMIKKEVNKPTQKFHSENFDDLVDRFPVKLKNLLLYNMFKYRLQKINFFKDLPAEMLVALGQALTPIVHTKGAPSLNSKVASYTRKETPPTRSTSS